MKNIQNSKTLTKKIASIITGTGSSDQEAQTVASNLVMANLSGHDSHGVGMVPRYVDSFLQGGLKPNSSVKVILDTGSLLTLDGQQGYGQVIGEQAMAMGIERAQKHGSCIMSIGKSHHLGRIGHFSEMAVAQGLVSIHFVNVISRPVVAAFEGADGRYGTNPCCIGIPLKNRAPFILDFATSRVAQGKMRVAHNEGRSIPLGTLIDEDGKPTTNPGVVVVPQKNGLFGALMAFGEHKGYGLAVACELLGGALTGSGTQHMMPDSTARMVYNGMFSILIDPRQLGTQESFEREADTFIEWLQNGPVAPDSESIKIAGDPERDYRIERLKNGIEIDATTWKEIVAAGDKVGVKVDL